MTEPEHAYSFLENFIQLIQLWAGICLLFFYQPFLEKSPLLRKIEQLSELFKNFYFKNQALFAVPGEEVEMVYDPTKWTNFAPRIKNMAALTFYYCVFLLVYIGVERSWGNFYSVTHPSFLVVANFFVLLYVLCCSMIDWKRFRQNRTPALYMFSIFIIFIIYKVLYHPIKELCNINILVHANTWFWVTSGTLFVCVSAMLIILIRVSRDRIVIKKNEIILQPLESFKSLYNEFDRLDSINKEIHEVKALKDLNEETQRIVGPLLSVKEDSFKLKKDKIIKELRPNSFLEKQNEKYIKDLEKSNSYENLNFETKKFIFENPALAKYVNYQWDMAFIAKKIDSIKKDKLKEAKIEESLLFIKKTESSTLADRESTQNVVKLMDNSSAANK